MPDPETSNGNRLTALGAETRTKIVTAAADFIRIDGQGPGEGDVPPKGHQPQRAPM